MRLRIWHVWAALAAFCWVLVGVIIWAFFQLWAAGTVLLDIIERALYG